ncbi:MAG: T9SS type A sorting domain-containing protein [Bacteroidota bacterium]
MKTKLIFIFFICSYFTVFAQWKSTNGLFSGEVHSVITSDGEIIVGTKYIYKSSDSGKTWFISNNGISGSVSAIRGLVKISTYLVAGTDAGVFYSTDNGDNWIQSAGTASLNVWCVIVKGTNLFLSTSSNGVYKSTSNGSTWTAANTGITPLLDMRSLVVKGNDIYAATDGDGIYKSSNDGALWTTVNTGLPGSFYAVSSLAVVGNNIIAGTYGAGVYKSTNDGGNWSAINNGVSSADDIMGMGVNGTSIYASTLTGNLYKTTDYTNWNSVSLGTFTATRFEAFYSTGSEFYVGTWGTGSTEKSYGVFKTTDDGVTWIHIGITDYPVSVLEVSGNNILGGTYDVSGNSFRTSFYKTTEADSSWSFNIGGFNGMNVTALKANGAVMYLFDDEGPGNSLVYRSTNNGNNWTSTGFNVLYNNFVSFVIAGSLIYAGDNSVYYSSSHIFVSADNGQTWTVINNGLPSSVHYVYSLVLKGTYLFAGTDDGVYKNIVGQNNWTAVSSGLTNMYIKSLCVSGINLYAGTQGGGIFKSSNDSALWTDVSTGIPLFTNVTCFTSYGSQIFAGTDNGIFTTENGGASWTSINTGLTDTSITALTASANYLWAGTYSQGVWRRELSQIITGTEETLTEPSFSVSPNPASTSITIEIPEGQHSDNNYIFIFNSAGRIVWQKKTSDTVISIDINSFPKGIYLLQISNSEKIHTEKIVIQ